MIYTYPAIFIKYKKDGSYGAHFPDLGCCTDGCDLNDAMAMAIDLLSLNISIRKDYKENIPEPTNINEIDCQAYINKLEIDFTSQEKV